MKEYEDLTDEKLLHLLYSRAVEAAQVLRERYGKVANYPSRWTYQTCAALVKWDEANRPKSWTPGPCEQHKNFPTLGKAWRIIELASSHSEAE